MGLYDKYTHMNKNGMSVAHCEHFTTQIVIAYSILYHLELSQIYNVEIIKMCLSNVNTWNVPLSTAAMLPQIVQV